MTPAPPDTTIEDLLAFIKATRGFDFTGYKRSSLERRVAQAHGRTVGCERYEEYIDYLELHPEEFAAALQHDPHQRHGLLPRPADVGVPARRDPPRARRAPAGRRRSCASGAPACASGEEAYTVAMVFAGVLGEQAFQDRVKIYATDADEEALDQARAAAYRPRRSRACRRALLERYFERTDQRYVFRKDLRRVGDLRAQRPRPGRADLAHRPARLPQHAHVLQRRDAGAHPAALPLRARRRGRAAARQVGDAAHATRDLFAPDRPQAARVPQGRAADAARPRPLMATRHGRAPADGDGVLRNEAFDLGARRAQLVVDRDGALALANEPRRRMFGLARQRPRAAARRPRDLLPAGRAARAPRARVQRRGTAPTLEAVHWRSPTAQDAPPRRPHRAAATRRRRCSGRAIAYQRRDATAAASRRSSRRPGASSRTPTRSCSRRSRSSRRPTRSSSRPTRSSRPPTRSSSRPTRSSRR